MATQSSILAWRSPMDKRSLAGYSPWGHKELDTTEQLHFHFHISPSELFLPWYLSAVSYLDDKSQKSRYFVYISQKSKGLS